MHLNCGKTDKIITVFIELNVILTTLIVLLDVGKMEESDVFIFRFSNLDEEKTDFFRQCSGFYSTVNFLKPSQLEVNAVYLYIFPIYSSTYWTWSALNIKASLSIDIQDFSCNLPLSFLAWHSYIWRHLDIGYVQGMCDLLAPLLVILDDGESPPPPASLSVRMFWQKSLPAHLHLLASAFAFQRPRPLVVLPSSWREWIKTSHTEGLWTLTLPTCAL